MSKWLLGLFLTALIVSMTLKGGTSGACAACKYQRRRCAPDCPLAPYFPAEQSKLFQNVHRLFGVRSIVKILESLDDTQRPEAMQSIIFQAFIRERSPVHGCLGLTQQLQYAIYFAEEELKVLNSHLQLYRSQQPNNQNHNHNHLVQEFGDDNKQQIDLGMTLNVNHNQSNVATPFFSPLPVSETQQPQMSYSEVNNNGYSPLPCNTDSGKGKEIILNNNNNVWDGQNRFLYNNNNNGHEMKSNNGVVGIQSQLINLQMVSNHHGEEDAHEYDDMHQFLEIIDDKQSFADSKEAYASSSGESLKEHINKFGENELRTAATCFSLTSVN